MPEDSRTQQTQQLALGTPLGDDTLLLRGFSGGERLGRLFEYRLEMSSEDHQIAFDDIVGQNVTVRVTTSPNEEPRYFNGFVNSFSQGRSAGDATEYRATIVPWLWFLTRTSDCRIFQNKTVPQIIQEVLDEFGFTDFDDRLHGSYRTWEYCVQYRETSFNFLSRLMEQEGIYYYWRHENGRHVLVLCDDASAHEAYGGYEEVQFRPPEQALREREYIHDWTVRRHVQPGMYAHTDFDFTAPKKDLLSSSAIARRHALAEFEIYDYPGEFTETSEGQGYARSRIEELQARFETAGGESNCRGICVGSTFTLTEHPREDQNREYLVTATTISARVGDYQSGQGGGTNYTCGFSVLDTEQRYRSARVTPRPAVDGPQTAMVCGPSGEEIYTDQYGRVKVMFHWDRYSQADENSSCWIRVAQVWAGKKWGAMFIPRIGQEVIVEFLEGDPDRPIITGRVYNGESMPPYELPGEMTKSTIKSNSSKGGGGFNEIRFEDKKGEEQIFVHAERNQDIRVEADRLEWVGHDRHLRVENDKFEEIKNDRHEVVKNEHFEEIGADRNLLVRGHEAKEVQQTTSLTSHGDVDEEFMQNHKETVTIDYTLKALNITLEASASIELKVGGSKISMNPGMISISAPMVKIN